MKLNWNELKELFGKEEIKLGETVKLKDQCFSVKKLTKKIVEFEQSVCPMESQIQEGEKQLENIENLKEEIHSDDKT
jgi:hypothetical protein